MEYKIELAICGMVDGPPGELAVSERLEKLRAYGARVRAGELEDTGVKYQRVEARDPSGFGRVTMDGYPAFGGSISAVVVRPLEKAIDVCAAHGPGSARPLHRWEIPFDVVGLQKAPLAVSVDVVQDLLVVVQSVPQDLMCGWFDI